MKRSYKNYKKSFRKSSFRRSTPRPLAILPANKAVDIPATATTLNSTAQANLLNGIVQGAAFYQRLGNRFAMKACLLKATIYPLRTATQLNEIVRFVLVYDRQANGAAPTYTDIIQSRDNAGGTSSTTFDNANIDKKSRYMILWDWWQPITTQTVTGAVVTNVGPQANAQVFKIQKLIPLPNLLTQCDGATGGIGDIETGSLYLFTVGSTAAASEAFTCSFSNRLFFYDAAS